MSDDFLSIGANRRCGRCGKKDVDKHKVHGIEVEGDAGIGKGRSIEIEDILCLDCRYELEEWMYGDEYSPRKEVDLTFHLRSTEE